MARQRSSELEPLVTNFEHLSDKPRADEALHSLRKIASLVKPIMRQRGWHVGTLGEFWPSEEPNLLGLNHDHGRKIQLRLRYPGDVNQFMPIDDVTDTMLHELCHIVIGPHNADFHALWGKLRQELELLQSKGYSGEGFLGSGSRLGGRRIPMSEIKRQARAAAEKRRNLTAGSGQKLGGGRIMPGQDARAVIAAAVERRLRIEKGCASDTDRGRRIAREEEAKKEKVTRTTVEQEDEQEAAIMQAYIELIQEDEKAQLGDDYIPPTKSNPAGSKAISSSPSNRSTIVQSQSPRSLLTQQRDIEYNLHRGRNRQNNPFNQLQPQPQSQPPPKKRRSASPAPPPPTPSQTKLQNPRSHEPAEAEQTTWTCEICTLLNPLQFLTCDACGTERPPLYNLGRNHTHSSSSLPGFRHSSSNQSQSNNNATTKANSKNNDHSLNNIKGNVKHGALAPRQNVVDTLRKFDAQAEYKKRMPVGWKCGSCGNWMEMEWWTCSVCGRMKSSS